MTRLRSRSTTSTRSTTLLIALLSLTSNTLSSIFVHQLPDDPFHLAANYGMYLHFANVMSVFGVIGGLRKHPLSIFCFSTYLLLDTLLSTIPRLLLLTLLSNSSSILCTPSSTTSLDFTTQIPSHTNSQELSLATYSISSHIPASSHVAGFADFMGKTGGEDGWTEKGCERIMYLGYVTLMGGVMVAMGLQVLGALCVRDYARGLFVAERNEELENGDGEWERQVKEESEERREKVRMMDSEGFRPLLVLDREEGEEFRRMTPILEERGFF
ncbi:hypothetical protein OCU04_002615 [Sclerotinia nivalis]|uniref:Uncharacterized protein n=1 Tax=Sclerotinia nivalis TaxID=352851 RepID=A0A9X0AUY9_9HELO|nr:hypothetical protein OCU04_002615 [Sclerotinia nivalis]